MNPVTRFRELRRREEGAEAVEFALIGPLLFFVVFGLIYLLVLFAAQLSLGYATNVAVRYAAIPEDAFGNYPTGPEALAKALETTPFFSAAACTPTLTSGAVNQPVVLDLECDFPNPAGGAANAFRSVMLGGGSGDEISSTVTLSATAQSRRE